MPIESFDHVNIRTNNLDAMIDWYGDILGLYPGPRPDFGFPGAWLYLKSHPLIHLVQEDQDVSSGGPITLEHFALRATGITEFLAKLESLGIQAQVNQVPDLPIVQVNIYDPDNNHIHIDFSKDDT